MSTTLDYAMTVANPVQYSLLGGHRLAIACRKYEYLGHERSVNDLYVFIFIYIIILKT